MRGLKLDRKASTECAVLCSTLVLSLILPPHLFCLLNKIILDFDGFSIKLFGFLIELCAKIVRQEEKMNAFKIVIIAMMENC